MEANGLKRWARDRVANELTGLAVVFVGADAQSVDAPPCFDFFRGMLRFVELLEHLGQPVEITGDDFIAFDELVEKMALGKLPHLHRVFHHLITVAELDPSIAPGDGHNAEINAGGEPAIEHDLAFAEVPAPLQCGKIEEAEVHRLLHFVNERRRDEDERGVGLHQAHCPWPMWIGVRVEQEREKLLLGH